MLELIKEEQETNLLEDLLEFVKDEEKKVLNLPVEKENFKIHTPEQANFFLGRVKELQEERTGIEETAKKEKERITKHIDSWKERELNKNQYSLDFIIGALELFFSENSEGKAISLPNGSINYRKQPLKYEYTSEEDIVQFALRTNLKDAVTTKYSLNKNELKKKATVKDGKVYIGEMEVPGVYVTQPEPKFTIR